MRIIAIETEATAGQRIKQDAHDFFRIERRSSADEAASQRDCVPILPPVCYGNRLYEPLGHWKFSGESPPVMPAGDAR